MGEVPAYVPQHRRWVDRLGDDIHVLLALEHQPQRPAHHGMVVGQDNANGRLEL